MLGRPYLIFFGFTHCPDVDCTTLNELSAILHQLGPDADHIGTLFVTVDPQRDTPKVQFAICSLWDIGNGPIPKPLVPF
jgi:protein SCO1